MVSGAIRPLPLPALSALLLHRQTMRHQQDYLLQLVWVAGAQLFALGGGKDYPMPEPSALFPEIPADQRDARAIRQAVLQQIRSSAGKEEHHGQAV